MNCYTPSFRQVETNFQPIRRTAQIWVVTHYQHGISAFIPADLPTPRPCKSGVFERKPPKTSRLGPQTWSSPNNVSNKTQKMKIIFVIVFFALLDMIYSTHFKKLQVNWLFQPWIFFSSEAEALNSQSQFQILFPYPH